MIDQIYDRHYQGARHAMNADATAQFGRLFRALRNTFSVLNRIEFSAPWASGRKLPKHGC